MIAVTASPTGGHIYPAIAIGQQLTAEKTVFFTEKNRIGSEIIKKYGFTVVEILGRPRGVWQWIKNIRSIIKQLRELDVKGVVATGGYTTISVIIAAWWLKRPILLLEQNLVPGRTNRVLQHVAHKICISFKETEVYFNKNKVLLTGNPVRSTFLEDRSSMKIDDSQFPTHKTLLVFGGSQGAEFINKWIKKEYGYFMKEDINLIHITGGTHYDKEMKEAEGKILKNNKGETKIVAMPYCDAMDKLYALSSLVICRAGATSIAELKHFKVPSILVPYPHATDNHQLRNAEQVKKEGISDYILEENLNFQDLMANYSTCIAKQQEMFEKMTQNHPPAEAIEKTLIELIRSTIDD